jgi:hypothetical protein
MQNMYTVLHSGDRLTTEMRVKTPADDPKTLSVVRLAREKWQKLFRLSSQVGNFAVLVRPARFFHRLEKKTLT